MWVITIINCVLLLQFEAMSTGRTRRYGRGEKPEKLQANGGARVSGKHQFVSTFTECCVRLKGGRVFL